MENSNTVSLGNVYRDHKFGATWRVTAVHAGDTNIPELWVDLELFEGDTRLRTWAWATASELTVDYTRVS